MWIEIWKELNQTNSECLGKVRQMRVPNAVHLAFDLRDNFPRYIEPLQLEFNRKLGLRPTVLVPKPSYLRSNYILTLHFVLPFILVAALQISPLTPDRNCRSQCPNKPESIRRKIGNSNTSHQPKRLNFQNCIGTSRTKYGTGRPDMADASSSVFE
jgi:hypothetical protein